MKLDNSIAAVVTGGASGLGAATARALAAKGVRVALFDLNAELGERVAAEIGGLFCAVNVTDDASVDAGFVQARAAHGQERVLVNCAGTGNAIKTVSRDKATGELRHFPLAEFEKIIQINLIGTFRCTAKAAVGMASLDPVDGSGERGAIVNTASVAAEDGQMGQAAYAASKGGVVSLTLPLAHDLMNADIVVVAARLAGTDTPRALVLLVLLVVERGMEGFERGRNLKKMGLSAQDTAELFFANVKVPKTNVLGEPGRGFYHLMEGLAEERLIAAVGAAANARRAFDVTRDYVMQRVLFGQPLAQQQNTQFRMAEMDAEIDLVQTYVDHCVAEHNAGRLTGTMGAKAKMLSTETEWRMMDLGVQLHGGAGYMDEYPISHMFTDARVNRILAGSSEVMRLIIGRDVFSQNYHSLLA